MEVGQTFTPPHPLNTAVLFLVFNRLSTTKQVFEAIRQAKPPRLYVAADGYRPDRTGEDKKVRDVRDYVLSNIDWNCEVKTLFRDRNMGCGVAVSNAIDWFFEFEESGIIFEDDVLPDPSFFPFCEALLERYRDESQIMMISGNYFAGDNHRPTKSYYFSRYNSIWGWATWRRAWKCNDRQMMMWPQLKQTNFLSQLGDGDKYFISFWSKMFDMVHAGRVDTWDYQFTFACWVNDGLSITPHKNLVKNIGFGADATHTFDDGNWVAKLPLQRIEFPLIHPSSIECNVAADRWSDRHVFGITFISLLKLWVKQQPGGYFMARMYSLFKRLLRRCYKLW
jgi:hypothetical protein